MLAAVKMHRTKFKVEGDIPGWLLEELRKRYGKGFHIDKEEKIDSVSLKDSEWFQDVRKRLTPGNSLRLYRKNGGLTQGELAKKLGPGLQKQHISNMEVGLRGISKALAKKLAAFFSTSVERFI